jgi:peptidoglycan/LPS O-acetylase OafA/YrhL
MAVNDGNLEKVWKIYLHRYLRLIPVYVCVLLFFWRVIPLFGSGPMFFMYEKTHECSKYWAWHLLFINNLIPWNANDNCMNWTWYLANDF